MIGISLAIRVGGGFVGGASLAGPVAPTATIAAGAADGEVVFDVTTLTATYGDAVDAGDGNGTVGTLEWNNILDGWQTLIDPEATGEVSAFVGQLLWGREGTIDLRRRNAEGIPGASISQAVTFAGDLHALEDVYVLSAPCVLDTEQVVAIIPA
jgi:hypothetical protein